MAEAPALARTDPANPEMQMRMLVGEFIVTIAHLEAQKAALTIQVQTLTAELAKVTKPEATD